MSVCIYERDEMQLILDAIKLRLTGPCGIHVWTGQCMETCCASKDPAAGKAEMVAWALENAWIAQYAAAIRTYELRQDPNPMAPPVWKPLDPTMGYFTPKAAATSPVELAERVENIMYNCVSNGGTDFCPEKARKVLEGVVLELYRFAAGR